MLHILKLVHGILVVEIAGMLYTRHHQWVTLDVIYLLHGTRVTREKIALVSPLKCPAWQPILNPVYLKLENRLFVYAASQNSRPARCI